MKVKTLFLQRQKMTELVEKLWPKSALHFGDFSTMITFRARGHREGVGGQPISLTGVKIFAYYSSITPLCFSMPIIPQIMLA